MEAELRRALLDCPLPASQSKLRVGEARSNLIRGAAADRPTFFQTRWTGVEVEYNGIYPNTGI